MPEKGLVEGVKRTEHPGGWVRRERMRNGVIVLTPVETPRVSATIKHGGDGKELTEEE